MENMMDLMDEPIEVQDIPNALPILPMKGKVDFRNVSFYYSPERPILKDISFTIQPGQIFSLIDPSQFLRRYDVRTTNFITM